MSPMGTTKNTVGGGPPAGVKPRCSASIASIVPKISISPATMKPATPSLRCRSRRLRATRLVCAIRIAIQVVKTAPCTAIRTLSSGGAWNTDLRNQLRAKPAKTVSAIATAMAGKKTLSLRFGRATLSTAVIVLPPTIPRPMLTDLPGRPKMGGRPLTGHSRQRSGFQFGEPVLRAQLHAFAFELAAGGHDVATARRAHRRGIARAVHDLGEFLDLVPVGAFIGRAGPGIERDEIDLRRNAANELHQFFRIGQGIVHALQHHIFERDAPRVGGAGIIAAGLQQFPQRIFLV